jgi:hypothetical protein
VQEGASLRGGSGGGEEGAPLRDGAGSGEEVRALLREDSDLEEDLALDGADDLEDSLIFAKF